MATTKIRLHLDVIIQIIIFIYFITKFITEPQDLRANIGFFALSIATWQVLHAFYVVRKYSDWQRNIYLYQMRQLLAYAIFTIAIGLVMLAVSWGYLYNFIIFGSTLLYIIVCAVIAIFAILYLIQSFKNLYTFYQSPRSFWDL